MIVLDTNVLSEIIRKKPNGNVETWLEAQPLTVLFTTAITQAEMLLGVALLPGGRRRHDIENAVAGMFDEDFAGRVLSFDEAAARSYAVITAAHRRAGRPIAQFDAQIAAIAHSRKAILATRNTNDFAGCGIEVINPWESR